jgi:hypothetical protein
VSFQIKLLGILPTRPHKIQYSPTLSLTSLKALAKFWNNNYLVSPASRFQIADVTWFQATFPICIFQEFDYEFLVSGLESSQMVSKVAHSYIYYLTVAPPRVWFSLNEKYNGGICAYVSVSWKVFKWINVESLHQHELCQHEWWNDLRDDTKILFI